jgi:hypothetical protein
MFPVRQLGSVSRVLLAASAFGAFACAFAGVPLGARGAAGMEPASPPLPPAHQSAPPSIALPHRDPFAGGEPAVPPREPTLSATPVPAIAIPATLGPLPPNAGAGGVPFPFGAETVRVRAVITGPRPFALVEDAGTTRLVTLGDVVSGDAIAAITAGGVRLTHGRTIAVAHAAPAAQPSSGGSSQ